MLWTEPLTLWSPFTAYAVLLRLWMDRGLTASVGDTTYHEEERFLLRLYFSLLPEKSRKPVPFKNLQSVQTLYQLIKENERMEEKVPPSSGGEIDPQGLSSGVQDSPQCWGNGPIPSPFCPRRTGTGYKTTVPRSGTSGRSLGTAKMCTIDQGVSEDVVPCYCPCRTLGPPPDPSGPLRVLWSSLRGKRSFLVGTRNGSD